MHKCKFKCTLTNDTLLNLFSKILNSINALSWNPLRTWLPLYHSSSNMLCICYRFVLHHASCCHHCRHMFPLQWDISRIFVSVGEPQRIFIYVYMSVCYLHNALRVYVALNLCQHISDCLPYPASCPPPPPVPPPFWNSNWLNKDKAPYQILIHSTQFSYSSPIIKYPWKCT